MMDPSTPSIPARTAADRGPPAGLRIESYVPRTDHNPIDLMSWAKRTGINPNSPVSPPPPAVELRRPLQPHQLIPIKDSGTGRSPISRSSRSTASGGRAEGSKLNGRDKGLGHREIADLEIEPIHYIRGESRGIEIERAPEPVRDAVGGIVWMRRFERWRRAPGIMGMEMKVLQLLRLLEIRGSKRDVEKDEAELEFDYFLESPEQERVAEY